MARVLKIVAGASAILGLIFAVRQSTIYVGDYRGKQKRVSELLAVADLQRASRDYRGAWTSLRDAAATGARADTVQLARENLAMAWLGDASTASGLSLGTIGDTLTSTLTRGALGASGARKADLLAHLGWADFLRWRDGQRQLDPAARYRQALAADSQNLYAHAMLGHWVLWQGDDIAEANRHFAAALASGRQRRYVRRLQLSALGNTSGNEARLEMLRVANDMRISGDSLDESQRSRLWGFFDPMFFSSGVGSDPARLAAAIAPRDLLLTYRWIFEGTKWIESKGPSYTYSLARLEEAAGDTARALATYQAARAQSAGGTWSFMPGLDAAIARLSRPR